MIARNIFRLLVRVIQKTLNENHRRNGCAPYAHNCGNIPAMHLLQDLLNTLILELPKSWLAKEKIGGKYGK